MTERLTHQRTKGPASTPAQRLVELQNALSATDRELQVKRHEILDLERKLDRFHRMTDTSFGGVPMAQIWADLWMWEAVLNENRQLRAIFEIGTWKGGFSWWLWAQAQARGLEFHTFDSIAPETRLPQYCFTRLDVFASSMKLGDLFHEWEPCVVFCDGGNKPRELKTFSLYLTNPDSLMVVHDWGTEMLSEDVPDTVEMVYGDFCEEIGSITRLFKPKENDA